MRSPKSVVIISLLLCLTINVNAQNSLSRVKIFVPPLSAERLEVISLLDIDHFQEENGAIQTEIGEEELALLKASKFRYQVLIENIAAHLVQVNKPYFEGRRKGTINIDGTSKLEGVSNRVAFEQPGAALNNIIFTPSAFQVHGTLGGYYSFAQMEAAMDALVLAYPAIASKTAIGTSVEGKTIWVIKISDNVGTDETNEPEAFFQGVQHAREAIGGSSMIFFMQYLCQAYTAGDSRIVNLVNNREIFIIPCMNPDGWEYNRSTNPSGGGGWRKNRKIIAGNKPSNYEYGVDLNRNWSVDWAQCAGAVGGTSCGSGTIDTNNGTYWGTSAFSESETQAVRNFIQSHHIVVANDQHSVGPYFSLPFGRPGLHTGADTLTLMDQQWYTRIPALMGKYNGMRAGNSVQALGYEVAGGVKDWLLKGDIGTGVGSGMKTKIYGMTGEGGYGSGGSTFWPPATDIVNLCKGMTYQNLQMIYSAGSYVDIQDMSDIALNSKTGTLSFKIKRIGIQDQPVTITAIGLTNVTITGSPVIVNSLPNYYDTYTGTVNYIMPGNMPDGQNIRFAWRVQTGGQTFYDTVTKFYNPIELTTDDMEGSSVATKWNISGGWNYLADSGYAGSKALTESPNAAYPASTTRTAQYINTLNLTNATAAYITFKTKYRAENMHDKLQLQVSPDGSLWTPIAGKNTVQEPSGSDGITLNNEPALTGIQDDWVNETYNISSFAGNAAMRLRFVFTSDASSSFFTAQDAGFYIDDLKVIKSSTALITLPVHFKSFTGHLLPDETIRLDWQAETDNQHDYFEIEKSSNGSNFTSIGRGPSLAPYWHIDPSPFIGNNFYRIKQVDKNGAITYSHIVTVNYNPEKLNVSVYPNPVTDVLHVKINSAVPDQYMISITDLAGRKVHEEKITAGINEREINLKLKAAQLYILTIRNSKNEIVTTQKVIKK